MSQSGVVQTSCFDLRGMIRVESLSDALEPDEDVSDPLNRKMGKERERKFEGKRCNLLRCETHALFQKSFQSQNNTGGSELDTAHERHFA